jgi:hypothetical protein
VRYQEEGWQEPYESRGSRTDLRGTGGEIPPVYPTLIFKGVVFCRLSQYLSETGIEFLSLYKKK